MNVKSLISKYDNPELQLDEDDISSDIEGFIKGKESLSENELAELMAFTFMEKYDPPKKGWGKFYGPFVEGVDKDGKAGWEIPSIRDVTSKTLEYWITRGNESSHPILKARYYGLVEDFYPIIMKKQPPHEICKKLILAVIEIADNNLSTEAVSTYFKLEHALNVALRINNKTLVNQIKQAIISFEKENADDDWAGLWGVSFDLLMGNKKIILSDEEKNWILSDLHERLIRALSKEIFNFRNAELICNRLIPYYRKKGNTEKVIEVLDLLASGCLNHIQENENKSHHDTLEYLYKIHSDCGYNEKSKNFLTLMRKNDVCNRDGLKEFRYQFSIPKDVMDEFCNDMLQGDARCFFSRIAYHTIPFIDKAEKELTKNFKQNPLLYLCKTRIFDEDGRVIASIGSIHDDKEGHLIKEIVLKLKLDAIFIDHALHRGFEKYSINTSTIIKMIAPSPMINQKRIPIIEMGLNAYFTKDYITFVHLIVPQIEYALRNAVELCGGNVLRYNKSNDGTYSLKTFNDALLDDELMKLFGKDVSFYFRILFTDRRGLNIRNKVCHGYANPDLFNEMLANRMLLALLYVGLYRGKDKNAD